MNKYSIIEDIMEKALSLWEREFTIAGLRGSILDKNACLAHDIPSTSVMVVPAQIKDPDATAEKLSEILGADKAKIKATISKHVSTQKIQPEGRLISDDKAKNWKRWIWMVYIWYRIVYVITPTITIWRRCWDLPVSIIRDLQV